MCLVSSDSDKKIYIDGLCSRFGLVTNIRYLDAVTQIALILNLLLMIIKLSLSQESEEFSQVCRSLVVCPVSFPLTEDHRRLCLFVLPISPHPCLLSRLITGHYITLARGDDHTSPTAHPTGHQELFNWRAPCPLITSR